MASAKVRIAVRDGRKIVYNRLRATDPTGRELPARIEVGSACDEMKSLKEYGERGTEDFPKPQKPPPNGGLTVVVNDSGAVYPIASFPPWLKAFAKINPEAYAVDAMKSVLFKGAGMGYISGDIVFLMAFTAIMMTLSILTFKRTL